MKDFFFCSLLFCFCPLIASEKMVFDMYLMGTNIGQISVSYEKKEDGSEHYSLTSRANAKVMWIERNQKTSYEIVYKNNALVRSSYSYIENTGNNVICDISFDGAKYQVKRNGKQYAMLEKPSNSIISVYFREPENLKKVFYEPDAVFVDLKSPAPHTYEFKSPDGTKNVYFYQSGKLSGMEFHQSLFTVKVKRVQ
jgi:hypothetical protein